MVCGCILCGFVILSSTSDYGERWLREYRAIYSHPSGYSVTGVGYYDDSASWTPPLDPAGRWDDDDDDDDDDDSNLPPPELPVMQDAPLHGRHGFVLHEACWMLLRRAWGSGEIRVDRLIEMCESTPFPLRTSGLGWPHRYEGLLSLETQDFFSWQETFFIPRELPSVFWDAMENPYDVPTLPAILLSCAKPQPARGTEKTVHDCFSRLAWELREAITILLSTADALALRQASASFLPLLSSTAFWASRFAGDWERSFVFEMHGCQEPTDWLELYRLTSPKSDLPSLRNRCRVWYSIKSLIDIAKLDRSECFTSATAKQAIGPPWSHVTGDMNFDGLEGNWKPFDQGCRSMSTIVVQVPEGLLKIGVSTIRFSTMTYVSGLRFVADNASDVRIGYISSSSETFFSLQELFGLKVAMAPSGLRALQIVGKNSDSSQWLGCRSSVPVSERLVRSQPIKAVTVRLDGYKIVGLGVTGVDGISDKALETADPPLRETAL